MTHLLTRRRHDVSKPAEHHRFPAFQGILPIDRGRIPAEVIAGTTLAALGIPTEADYVAGYANSANIPGIDNYSFFLAFAFFRFAAIAQGVYARALAGNASAPNALQVGLLAAPLADLGWKAAQA